MNILEMLKSATGPLKVSEANDLAYEAGFHGENYALMVAALRGGVDAVGSALALVERMLPDSRGDVHWGNRGAKASVLCPDGSRTYHEGATPALAILKALFAAKERQL